MPSANILRDRRGNVAMLTAAVMPLLIGAGGLAVDTISWALVKRELQRAADSAAIAGASAALQGKDVDAAVTRALSLFEGLDLNADPDIENAPTSGEFLGDERAVRVTLAADGATWFSSFFGHESSIAAQATAAGLHEPRFCMVSLETTTAPGITFTGDADVDLDCGMTTNSRGTPAITAEGSATINATDVGAVGDLTQSEHFDDAIDFFPGQPATEDPYADLVIPSTSTCSPLLRVNANQERPLSPGCFRGMTINGTANLSPGVYVINGGQLTFGAGARVTGSDVTFILTGSNAQNVATLNLNGHPHLDLSAPDDGDYAGVLIYQNAIAELQTNGVGNLNVISGDSTSILQGAFYFPSQAIQFIGNGSMNSDCLRIVARRIQFSGNSSAGSESCPRSDDYPLYGAKVKLVS
ncbi:MAG TPA: pilus assembly protein TadG-related protein [Allosphingosinicella sp.]|jgi:Flp pilus assembly protein TadG